MKRFLDKIGVKPSVFAGFCCAIIVAALTLIPRYDKPGAWNNVLRHIGNSRGSISAASEATTSIIISFFLIAFLYIRKIMIFSNNFWGKLIAIVVNALMFGGVIALILDGAEDQIKNLLTMNICIIILTFCATMLLFGQKGMARIVFLITLFGFIISVIDGISEALGLWGVLIAILFFVSMYLQENINLNELLEEFKLLYGKTSAVVKESASLAADETAQVGDALKKAAVTATIASNPAAGAVLSSALDTQPQAPQVLEKNTESSDEPKA